jgi:hypothetical protein
LLPVINGILFAKIESDIFAMRRDTATSDLSKRER